MQLVSEARIKKPSGRPMWVRRSKDNHYLDCEAMAYAAGYLLNVQRIPEGTKARIVQDVAPPLAAAAPKPADDWFNIGSGRNWMDR